MNRHILLSAILAVSANALAADAFWSGDTTGQPVFNRPVSLTSLSGVGTAVPYEVQLFYVTANGNYTFEVNGTGHPDTYILVYGGSFNAATPLVGLMDGDDDFSGTFTVLTGTGQGFASSRIAAGETSNFTGGTGLNLVTGTQYYAVVTGFGNSDFGRYNAGIGGGPGDVRLGVVPEPATMVALGAGLAALAARRRRK